MDEAESRARVGELVRERRLQLGKSVPEFADSVEIDVKTLRSLEAGERWPREVTRRKIEQGLGWSNNWMQRSFETGETPDAINPVARARYNEKVRNHVYGAMESSTERLRDKLAHGTDPKELSEQMSALIEAARRSFSCIELAMELQASTEEADRFIDGAMGLLITSGALQVAGFSGESSDILSEWGAAKDLIRASRERPSESVDAGQSGNASAREKAVPVDASASQDDYELAGGNVAYRRGMTEERQRRMVEKEPEDIADAEGPEHGA